MRKEFISVKNRRNFLGRKILDAFVLSSILSFCIFCFPVFAADGLNSAKALLSKGAIAGGGLWAAWGLVSVGIAIKDHNGPGISGGIWQIIGGGIIVAAGTLINNLDLSMTV